VAGERDCDMDLDLEAFAAEGLYDPHSPAAADRHALLAFLVERGCTMEEIVHANARGRLFALAGDRLLRPDRDRFTLAEVAAQLGADVDVVRRAWRAFGLVELGPDTKVASPADVEALPVYLDVVGFLGEETALSIARVWGSAMARVADAEGGAGRAVSDDASLLLSGSELATAQFWAGAAEFYPRASRLLDILHRHHAESSIRQFEASGSERLARTHQTRYAVGFADLTGFTSLSETIAPADLSMLLARFEQAATNIAQDRGGRVIKFIGDAAMIIAPRPAVLADIAAEMVNAEQDGGRDRIPVRAGLAYGDLLARDGDYFGPDVNLAARLVAVAEPDSILVSATFAESLPPEGWILDAHPPRPIRGFADPVSTFTLRRAQPVT
jgi:class 3 adenylate cyclase